MSDTNTYHRILFDLIDPTSNVLDLGCGDGSLLESLIQKKQVTGYGVDYTFSHVSTCVSKGLPVYQGDIDEGLSSFDDQSFDYVILSQTLQQVRQPLFVLSEMLRVGRKGIVTFPNFGYWKVRLNLLLNGQAPITPSLPYEWHDTPNIRVLAIRDFYQLCKNENISIDDDLFLFGTHVFSSIFPIWVSNIFSSKGIFVISSK